MSKAFQLSTFFLSALVFSGCGPKVTVAPQFAQNAAVRRVALLPTEPAATIQRERARYLRNLLRLALEEKGYVLLSDQSLAALCASVDCSDRAHLKNKYGIRYFALFTLKSLTRVNFLAGYVNSLEGEFLVEDESGELLFESKHTERDSGGIILESGQIIQAVINQARSGEEAAFDTLSYRFVSELLEKVPSVPAGEAVSGAQSLSLGTPTLSDVMSGYTKVCVDATPGQAVWLYSKPIRASSQLREIKAGQYCGFFRLEQNWSLDRVVVELRSPFGGSKRASFSAPIDMAARKSANMRK